MKQQTKLMLGDNMESLKKLPDNSIDSIVTDPPYGLSFMGKKWDYDVPSVDFWREVYRVLKPGGHILSFGGTRTYHRMVVNIEDAGFEIRDQVMWLYGSGFPKSRNIGKDIEKVNVGGLSNLKQVGTKKGTVATNHHELAKGEKPKGFSYKTASHSVSHSEVATARTQTTGDIPVYEINNEWEGWGTSLKPAQEIIAVAQKPENLEGTALNLIYNIKKELWKLYVKIVESSSELNQAEQKEVLDTALCLVEKNINIQDALQGVMDMSRLRLMENMNWSIVLLWHNILEDLYQKMSRYTTSTKSNLIIDLKTLKSLEWQNILESITQVKDNQIDGLSVNALTAVVLFNALNLKLKDIQQHSVEDNVIYKEDNSDCLNEPICVARKPLSEKTIAENVIKWGTGGINVDGCRIEGQAKNIVAGERHNGTHEYGFKDASWESNSEGRFPANIILDETAAELLDEQSGFLKGDSANKKPRKGGHREQYVGTDNNEVKNQIVVDKVFDSGGASRFFYVAKVSKKERNLGLDGFECEIKLTPTIKLIVKTDYNNKNLLWEKQDLKTELVDTDKSHQKDIEEYGAQQKEDKLWNTDTYGNYIMDQFQQDFKSIIEMEINSTTIYQILNSSIQKNTKTYIQELYGEAVKDINFVEDVEKKSTKMTFTLQEENTDGYTANVKSVLLKGMWSISVKENKCSHPTLKPINLMTYLCRLITPPGGIVLDPFMGSGSTGIAARLEGFRFLGMEMDKDYFKIAEARIEAYEEYRDLLKK